MNKILLMAFTLLLAVTVSVAQNEDTSTMEARLRSHFIVAKAKYFP